MKATLRNFAYASQMLTLSHGNGYAIASDGTVSADSWDAEELESLGFARVTGDSPSFFTVAIPLTALGLQTVQHRLGQLPLQVHCALICTDASGEGGYAQNEACPICVNSIGNPTQPFSFDSTNCYVLVESAGFSLPAKAGGSSFSCTTSKWSLLIVASGI
jgi:hypothetical protein